MISATEADMANRIARDRKTHQHEVGLSERGQSREPSPPEKVAHSNMTTNDSENGFPGGLHVPGVARINGFRTFQRV